MAFKLFTFIAFIRKQANKIETKLTFQNECYFSLKPFKIYVNISIIVIEIIKYIFIV